MILVETVDKRVFTSQSVRISDRDVILEDGRTIPTCFVQTVRRTEQDDVQAA